MRGSRRPGWLAGLRKDVEVVLERDPAARSALEVALLYPGVHAVWAHRASHWLWQRGAQLPARGLSQAARWMTGIEIHPGATLGDGVVIDHGSGVVIGETAEVGNDVTIYQGVTLGGTSLEHVKRHPTIGDRVTIGAGAKVLGNITVGDDTRIGANAVLVRSVDDHSVVVGVPGQVLSSGRGDTQRVGPSASPPLSDPIGTTVHEITRRLDQLEVQVTGHTEHSELHQGPTGVWEATDYSI